MRKTNNTYRLLITLLFCFLQIAGIVIYAQGHPRAATKRANKLQLDTTLISHREFNQTLTDTAAIPVVEKHVFQQFPSIKDSIATADSIETENKRKMLELTADPTLKMVPAPTDSLEKNINKKVWFPIQPKPPGWHLSFQAVVKFTTVNIGNFPYFMAVLLAVHMP
ncbi:hypothetical protein, secreted [gut metagenome]|uniref:Uncharacterized protein n=1 Tax=gut metagenome TaxID=749906 RepID=J9GEP6_9ZZZZ